MSLELIQHDTGPMLVFFFQVRGFVFSQVILGETERLQAGTFNFKVIKLLTDAECFI